MSHVECIRELLGSQPLVIKDQRGDFVPFGTHYTDPTDFRASLKIITVLHFFFFFFFFFTLI